MLRAGGCFALDFLNADRVREGLVESDERVIDQRRVVQNRRLEEDGKVVVKEILLFGRDGGALEKTYYERVRLYSPEELESVLAAAGLQPEITFGDYDGGPPGRDCPRYILMGHAV